ncbi:MAG: hypothetical protein HYV62_04435 [Candidatus Rokubacteria bacterium]|nr:hypothetical protein [Candidatus Rokubacteria bacterium]
MKITAPKDPAAYFEKTEHAVKHFYSGLDSCWSYYQQALRHWDVSQLDQPMTPERRAGLDHYLQLAGKYFDLKFSEATFAGSILQVAYMAIRLYSRNNLIPPSCAALVRTSHKSAIPFCIGPERHTVPVGLIVYAGRNQYSHWDEDEPHEVTRSVFDALSAAFRDNISADLAFSLGNPTINLYASEVLFSALGWTSYESYLAAMTALLESAGSIGEDSA